MKCARFNTPVSYCGDIAKLELQHGVYTIVDAKNGEWLSKQSWRLHQRGYAYGTLDKRKVLMHRLIIGALDSKQQVDHINGDRLDNRLENLRLCTQSQNNANMRTSGKYPKGVQRINGRYCATIGINGKKVYIGCFGSAKEAAKAYDQKAIELYGDFAFTNAMKNELRDCIVERGVKVVSVIPAA